MNNITVTSRWVRQRFKSPVFWLFAWPFVRPQIKENINASRHWPLWGESTDDRWFPSQKASNAENVSIWWRYHELFTFTKWNLKHVADGSFKCILVNDNSCILIQIPLRCVTMCPNDNDPVLVQVMALHRTRPESLSKAMSTESYDPAWCQKARKVNVAYSTWHYSPIVTMRF